jgi:hypothetical protein
MRTDHRHQSEEVPIRRLAEDATAFLMLPVTGSDLTVEEITAGCAVGAGAATGPPPRFSASLKHGVLRLRLPKVERARPRQITIQTD